MHVLIIASWYKTPAQPLSGTFFEEHARMLQKNGYRVGILYPALNSQFKIKSAIKQLFRKAQPEDFVDNGIPTMYSFSNAIVHSRFQKVNYWWGCFTAYNKFKKYVSEYGVPQVIHAHSVFIGGWVARYISRKEKVSYVFTEHTSSILTSQWITTDPVTREMVKKTFSDADTCTFVSNYFRENLISKYNVHLKRAITIPNSVNPIFHTSFVKKEKSDSISLLCVAVFNSNKQHQLLFEALELIINRRYDVRLTLIGDGPDKKQLIDYSHKKGLYHRITFMGTQSREIVKREIDISDIVISASKSETFGLSIIEAFACGRPVVAIDSGGPRDTITPENGLLVNENSAQKLAESIIYVIENYNSYNQVKIKSDCLEKYSEAAVFKMLEPVYNSAIKN